MLKEVCVAATDEQAMEVARPYLKNKYDAYVEWGQSDVLPPTDTLRREFAELTAGGRFVLGSPETCAAILADHIDRLGADHFVCRLQWPGMPQRRGPELDAAARAGGAAGRSRGSGHPLAVGPEDIRPLCLVRQVLR